MTTRDYEAVLGAAIALETAGLKAEKAGEGDRAEALFDAARCVRARLLSDGADPFERIHERFALHEYRGAAL